jgi:hypothetical protein
MCDLARDRDDTVKIYDAVEDAKSGADLAKRLNALQLKVRWTLDRDGPTTVRLRGKDVYGNTRFFIAKK